MSISISVSYPQVGYLIAASTRCWASGCFQGGGLPATATAVSSLLNTTVIYRNLNSAASCYKVMYETVCYMRRNVIFHIFVNQLPGENSCTNLGNLIDLITSDKVTSGWYRSNSKFELWRDQNDWALLLVCPCTAVSYSLTPGVANTVEVCECETTWYKYVSALYTPLTH